MMLGQQNVKFKHGYMSGQMNVKDMFNPLTLEFNPSAQRCLTRFLTGNFAS
jgi:hypothetical protein